MENKNFINSDLNFKQGISNITLRCHNICNTVFKYNSFWIYSIFKRKRLQKLDLRR